MRLLLSCLLLLALCGCKKTESSAPDLLSRAKAALSAREAKLVSFRYEGVTAQGDQRAGFVLAWRAPGKLRAEFTATGLTFAFDGRHFAQWDPRTKVLTRVDLEQSERDEVSGFLHQAFAPFVPEGWRSPLLAGALEARASVEGGRDLVALSARSGEVEVTYLFTSPAYDFFGKRVRGGGEARVLAQHCEAGLGLCFPARIEEIVPGAAPALTTLAGIVVNGPLAPEVFELQAPEGARVETRTLEQLSAR